MKGKEKVKLFMDTVRGTQVKRVPIMLDFEMSYVCEYAKTNFFNATWDYEDMLSAYKKVLSDFEMDINLGVQWLSPQKSVILGSRNWMQNKGNGVMQHPELTVLMETEYDALIENPMKCIQNLVLPRLHENLNQTGMQSGAALLRALMFEKNQMEGFYSRLYDLSDEQDAPMYYGTMFYAPFDLLADHLRGIRQISLDMRRRPEKVEQACEVLSDLMVHYVEKTMPVPEEGFPFACSWVHLPPMINPKQFERFFWPTFQKVCNALVEKGYTLYLQFQGDYSEGRYFNYYAKLPKGKIVIAVEHQNFETALEMMGDQNIISCSYPLHYLTNYSTEVCLEKAKELLDIGMKHQRFYFGFNKPAFSVHDAEFEKLKAVLRFIRKYGVY